MKYSNLIYFSDELHYIYYLLTMFFQSIVVDFSLNNGEAGKRVEANSTRIRERTGRKTGVMVENNNNTGTLDTAILSTVRPSCFPYTSKYTIGPEEEKKCQNYSKTTRGLKLLESAQICSMNSDPNTYAVVQHKSKTWTSNTSGKSTGAGTVSSNVAIETTCRSNLFQSKSSTELTQPLPPSISSMYYSKVI